MKEAHDSPFHHRRVFTPGGDRRRNPLKDILRQGENGETTVENNLLIDGNCFS